MAKSNNTDKNNNNSNNRFGGKRPLDERGIEKIPADCYILYTPEGFCTSPNDEDVENFQVLGFARGYSKQKAIFDFLKQNDWVIQYGYDPDEIMAKEII